MEALKDELEATHKNPVSIYFDENPHDGLLETHQVDASLAKKLKCLIFIPIISQTYSDETSFAWEHEFMPFIKMAKADELGMNITLSNGNVVSRVLPVKIHDLDSEDQNTLEAILDGPLRSIDFIYHASGVNRPLRANEDDPSANLNKAFYRDQVNKVANALKNIGLSILRNSETAPDKSSERVITKVKPDAIANSKRNSKRKLLITLAVVTMLVLAFFLLIPLLFDQKIDKNISEVGLAIMPFKNIANNPDINLLSFALKDEIHDVLALNKKFAFLSSSQATASYIDRNITPQAIGEELGVNYVLLGSYQISGDQLSVRVEFADTETGNSVWGHKFIVKYEAANIFPMQADIAQKVLAIFNEGDDKQIQKASTINLDAYAHYVKGLEWMNKGYRKETRLRAVEEFSQAVSLDSTHTQSWLKLIMCKANLLFHDFVSDSVYIPEIEAHIEVLIANHPQWAVELANGLYQYHALNNYEGGFEYFKSVLEKYPDNELASDLISAIYKRKLKNSLSFNNRMKTLELNPKSAGYWGELYVNFLINGDYKRALRSYLKALELGLDSTYISRYEFHRAGVSFDSIPQQFLPTNTNLFEIYKIFYSNNPQEIISGLKTLNKFDSTPGPNKYAKTEYYLDMAVAYQALYLDDSARYFAELSIAENDKQEEKEWFWVLQSYIILGNIEKEEKIIAKNFPPPDTEDLLVLAFDETVEIRFLALSKKYAEATKKLLDLNEDYPEYGDYFFLTRFEFDRAKKEYPPFAEAVANLKMPEPLVKDDGLGRLEY